VCELFSMPSSRWSRAPKFSRSSVLGPRRKKPAAPPGSSSTEGGKLSREHHFGFAGGRGERRPANCPAAVPGESSTGRVARRGWQPRDGRWRLVRERRRRFPPRRSGGRRNLTRATSTSNRGRSFRIEGPHPGLKFRCGGSDWETGLLGTGGSRGRPRVGPGDGPRDPGRPGRPSRGAVQNEGSRHPGNGRHLARTLAEGPWPRYIAGRGLTLGTFPPASSTCPTRRGPGFRGGRGDRGCGSRNLERRGPEAGTRPPPSGGQKEPDPPPPNFEAISRPLLADARPAGVH